MLVDKASGLRRVLAPFYFRVIAFHGDVTQPKFTPDGSYKDGM